MGGKSERGRARNGAKAAPGVGAAAGREAPASAEEFIAQQLKAMYDEVVAQPVPERFMELLNRLDGDAGKK